MPQALFAPSAIAFPSPLPLSLPLSHSLSLTPAIFLSCFHLSVIFSGCVSWLRKMTPGSWGCSLICFSYLCGFSFRILKAVFDLKPTTVGLHDHAARPGCCCHLCNIQGERSGGGAGDRSTVCLYGPVTSVGRWHFPPVPYLLQEMQWDEWDGLTHFIKLPWIFIRQKLWLHLLYENKYIQLLPPDINSSS